jgi:hypothetical protein
MLSQTHPVLIRDHQRTLQRTRLALNSDCPQDAEQIADEILKTEPPHGQALQSAAALC